MKYKHSLHDLGVYTDVILTKEVFSLLGESDFKVEYFFFLTVFKKLKKNKLHINNLHNSFFFSSQVNNNLIINNITYDFDNCDVIEPLFNTYTEDKKFLFFKERFYLQYCKEINIVNPLAYEISNTFMYITDIENNFYFFEIIDFKKHFISELNITFYSFCILTNSSFVSGKLQDNTYTFDIKIFFINFLITGTNKQGFLLIDDFMTLDSYINEYFTKNYNFLENKIKKSISFFKKHNILHFFI